MASFYSRETTGVLDGTLNPASRADGRVYQSKVRRIRATFDLASQVAASFLVIGTRPKGSSFVGVQLTTDTSLGSTTVSCGTAGSTARDKALAALTATDTPTMYGKVSSKVADPIAADEIVGLTTAAATLPASGILTVDYFYTISA